MDDENFGRLAPWKRIGVNNTWNVKTAEELIERAGLDWTVSLDPVYFDNNGVNQVIEGRWATVKNNKNGDKDSIAIVGSRYNPFQNVDTFSTLDHIVEEGFGRYSSMGEIGNGAVVWAVIDLPEALQVEGDPHAAHILARNSHDGSTLFEIAPIAHRIGCTNQINAALFANRTGIYKLKHTPNNRIDVDDIKRIINVVRKDFVSYANMAKHLMNMEFSNSEFLRFLDVVYPLDAKIANTPSHLLSVGEKRTLTRVKNNRMAAWVVWGGGEDKSVTQPHLHGTRFGALHAVIEVADHYTSNQDKADVKMLQSKDDAFKSRAFELITR